MIEGNVQSYGKSNIGIPEDRRGNGFFALITGQGDGGSSPRHFYTWIKLYFDEYQGVWELMDGKDLPGLAPFQSEVVPLTGEILRPAIEQNQFEGVPTDNNVAPTQDNYTGAIVWIVPTYAMQKVEYGFTYQPVLRWGVVKYDVNTGDRVEGENILTLRPCRRWDDDTPNGEDDIFCYIYSPYNTDNVFTDLKAGDIVCYIKATKDYGFLMPIKPVVVKFGKITADWVLNENKVNITPVVSRDDNTPTGEVTRDIFLFTPEGQITIVGINLKALDIVAYIPVQDTGYMIGVYHGSRHLDCNNNEIVKHVHEFKWGSGFTITRVGTDDDKIKVDLNIEIKSSDSYVDVVHSSVNDNGTYCKEVWDLLCPFEAGTSITIGPLVQWNNSSNCLEARSVQIFPCNWDVAHSNWTNVICAAPCNNGA